LIRDRVNSVIEWFAETPMIAILTISRLVMCDAKHPAANVLLRPAGGQVPMQVKKSILNYILRFVAGESQTYQVSKQRFAQFAIQSRSLTGAGREAQECRRQGNGIVAHKILSIALLFI
jgi:hypothetical protein